LPHSSPTARHKRTSAAILAAAAHVLAEDADAALDDVAAAAGVGRATLYRHFASREALLEALLGAAVAEMGDRLAAAGLDRVPVAEAIARIVRAALVVGDRYAVLMNGKPEQRAHPEADSLIRRPIREVFERGAAEGSLRSDISLEALVALFGSALSAGVRLVSVEQQSLEETAAAVTAFVLDGARTGPVGVR
jgi:AcrR family transcriptional regulator